MKMDLKFTGTLQWHLAVDKWRILAGDQVLAMADEILCDAPSRTIHLKDAHRHEAFRMEATGALWVDARNIACILPPTPTRTTTCPDQ